jgi:hypothetical protein
MHPLNALFSHPRLCILTATIMVWDLLLWLLQ